MEADSTVVIKITYGETMRRFRTRVIDGELNLTVDGFRSLIFSLFGFSPDTEITLTYIDEDGDVATIVDFIDLRDAVMQGLNPIRFTVSKLIHENDSMKINSSISFNPSSSPLENIDAVKFDSSRSFNPKEKMEKLIEDLSFKAEITESKTRPITNSDAVKFDSSRSFNPKEKMEKLIEDLSFKAENTESKTRPITNSDFLASASASASPSPSPSASAFEKVLNESNYPDTYSYPVYGLPSGSSSFSRWSWSPFCDVCGINEKSTYGVNSTGICTACFLVFESRIDRLEAMEFTKPKLQSFCVGDVNLVEGCSVPPSTRLTKIWKMRNNGFTAWPEKTRIAWIGGTAFTSQTSFEVKIPANGLMVDEDLDISVDFTSPEFPGYYTSFWVLMSPSYERFGQVISIYIKVDDALRIPTAKAKRVVGDSLEQPGNSKKGVEVVENGYGGFHLTADGRLARVETYAPGVEITLTSLPDGASRIERIRFSEKLFSPRQADKWWEENKTSVYEVYNVI